MNKNMRESLVIYTLGSALWNESTNAGLIIHTDRLS